MILIGHILISGEAETGHASILYLYIILYIILYIVTLPSQPASIRRGNLDGARAERPRQKKIARAVLKSPERRAIVIILRH